VKLGVASHYRMRPRRFQVLRISFGEARRAKEDLEIRHYSCQMATMESTWGKVMGVCSFAVTLAAMIASAEDVKKYTTWSDYEGSADSAQYSALTQRTPLESDGRLFP
jgi:hypothetical protein